MRRRVYFALAALSAWLLIWPIATFAFESSKLAPAVVTEGTGFQSSKLSPGIVVEGAGLHSSKLSPGIVLKIASFQSSKLSVGIVLEVESSGGAVQRAPLTHW